MRMIRMRAMIYNVAPCAIETLNVDVRSAVALNKGVHGALIKAGLG